MTGGGFIRSLAVVCVNAAAVAVMRQPLWVCVAACSMAPFRPVRPQPLGRIA